MMLHREYIKRETNARFFGTAFCQRCRQSKPKILGGKEQPGKDKYHRGPWWCADCVERQQTEAGG